jgi:hypothetical protein
MNFTKYTIPVIFFIFLFAGAWFTIAANGACKFDDGESSPRPRRNGDHLVPHDDVEEDAMDPGAVAMTWVPDSITGLW